MRQLISLIFIVVLYLPLSVEAKTFTTSKSEAVVLEVIDGDTITVRKNGDKQHVRMLFIDTMESKNNAKLKRDVLAYAQKGVQIRKKDMLALGKLATIYLRSVLKPGDRVVLESYQGNRKDRYGRLLAVVYKKDINVNLLMVREGYARVYFIGKVPENVKVRYQSEENGARAGNKVIWNYLK